MQVHTNKTKQHYIEGLHAPNEDCLYWSIQSSLVCGTWRNFRHCTSSCKPINSHLVTLPHRIFRYFWYTIARAASGVQHCCEEVFTIGHKHMYWYLGKCSAGLVNSGSSFGRNLWCRKFRPQLVDAKYEQRRLPLSAEYGKEWRHGETESCRNFVIALKMNAWLLGSTLECCTNFWPPMWQILMSNKRSRDVIIIVAGKAANAVASMFTIKINYPPLRGSILMLCRSL